MKIKSLFCILIFLQVISLTSCGGDSPDVDCTKTDCGFSGSDDFQISVDVGKPTPLSGTDPKILKDGQPSTWKWEITDKPEPSDPEIANPTAPTPTMTVDQSGRYRVTLTVDDEKPTKRKYTFAIKTKNRVPTASFNYTPKPVHVTDNIYLDSLGSNDPDNDPLSYLWSFIFKPQSSKTSLSNPNAQKPEFTIDKTGLYIVQLVVNDGIASSEPFFLSIVTENSKPVSIPGDNIDMLEGDSVILDGSKSKDVDDDILSYKWSIAEKPNNSKPSLNDDLTKNPTFIPDMPGEYVINLVTNDGKILSDPAPIHVLVKPVVDLEAVSIDSSDVADYPPSNIKGTVQVEIRNNGSQNVLGSYKVLVFEDKDKSGNYNASDTLLGVDYVTDSPSGKQSTSASVKVDGELLFAGNHLFVVLDSDNIIPERSKINNIISSVSGSECKPVSSQFTPKLELKWPKDNQPEDSPQVMCAPVVAFLKDDNGDGKLNSNDIPYIVFNSFKGNVHNNYGVLRAIRGTDGELLFSSSEFILDGITYHSLPTFNPAIADIDRDGYPEILQVVRESIKDNKRVVAISHKGELKNWTKEQSTSQNVPPASIAVADLDNDGYPEIITGNVVLNNDLTIKWIGNKSLGLNNSVTADINEDGRLEIVAGNTVYDHKGNVLWQNLTVGDGFTGVANFDNDSFPEIVLVSGGNVYMLENDGKIKWGPIDIPPIGTVDDHGGAPAISDVDGDGIPEIGIAGGSRYVLFKADGTIKWQRETKDPSSVTGSSFFDFDGDGKADIVYADEEKLRIYQGLTGNVIFEVINGSGTFIEMPVVVDVDNDNNAEIIVAANSYQNGNDNGIRVYSDANDNWVNTRKIWNQTAYSITNVNDDMSIPRYVKNNWEIYSFNNFRQNEIKNPFGCKDLTASRVQVNAMGCPNQVKVTARIGNAGTVGVSPGYSVSFYDNDPQNGGKALGTVEVTKRLSSGEYTDIDFTYTNPIRGVEHTVYVVADDNGNGRGIVREPDESNNKSWSVAPFICQ